MKVVTFKKSSDFERGTKHLSINHRSEDKNAITDVRKSFAYLVSRVDEIEQNIIPPQIYITKCFDTKTQTEKFSFRVKGSFYMNQHRLLLKVRFHHTLNISVINKLKILSPKKSAVLT